MPTLADNLKAAREELGWTIEQTADHCEVGRSTWYAYEKGTVVPSLPSLIRIARTLETTAMQLLDGVEE
jgi:DNA-binding XRE family transcriptional regulator